MSNDQVIDKISNFVEEIRFEASTGQTPPRVQQNQLPPVKTAPVNQPMEPENPLQAERLIIEAEQYPTHSEPPPAGNIVRNLIDRGPSGSQGDDDDFFHLVCNVDSALKERIQRGEYIELERLLPKRRAFEDNRLEWVTHDGMAFLAPTQDRESRITNIWKWEQAFRVYAALYCEANPGRAGEI